MTESKQQLDQSLTTEYLRIMTGWQNLEERTNSGFGPIDLVFVNSQAEDFGSRVEVRDRLGDYITKIPQNLAVGIRHIKTVNCQLAYLKALEGEKEPLRVYIPETTGMPLIPIPESYIMRIKQEFAERFADEGFSHNEAGWRRYTEAEPISKRDITRIVNHAKKELIPFVLEKVGRCDLPLDFKAKLVAVDRSWVSRVIGGPDIFMLEVNLHERNKSRQFKGSIEPIEDHESFHLVQALCLRDNIRKNELDLSNGITTIPGREQGPNEGMAQAWPLYIPEVLEMMSPFGRLAFDYGYLYDLVYANSVLIKANDDSFSDENIVEFVHEYLPGETEDRIRFQIDLRRNSPRYRSYGYSYFMNHYFRAKLRELPNENQRINVVKFLLNNQPDFDEIDEFIERQKAA